MNKLSPNDLIIQKFKKFFQFAENSAVQNLTELEELISKSGKLSFLFKSIKNRNRLTCSWLLSEMIYLEFKLLLKLLLVYHAPLFNSFLRWLANFKLANICQFILISDWLSISWIFPLFTIFVCGQRPKTLELLELLFLLDFSFGLCLINSHHRATPKILFFTLIFYYYFFIFYLLLYFYYFFIHNFVS